MNVWRSASACLLLRGHLGLVGVLELRLDDHRAGVIAASARRRPARRRRSAPRARPPALRPLLRRGDLGVDRHALVVRRRGRARDVDLGLRRRLLRALLLLGVSSTTSIAERLRALDDHRLGAVLVVAGLEDIFLVDLARRPRRRRGRARAGSRGTRRPRTARTRAPRCCSAPPTCASARPIACSTSRMRSGVAITTATTRPTHASSAVPAVLITARRISARCSPIAPPGPCPATR